MLSSFLITFREGLEAFLLVGIILAHLSKLGARQYFRYIYLGVGLGVLVSFIAAVLLQVVVDEFHQSLYRHVFMASVMLFAAGVLTYMVLWMQKQVARTVAHVHEDLSRLVSTGDLIGLVGLTFVSVAREGLETVLFFSALTYSASAGTLQSKVIGALMGLVVAIAVVWVLFRSTRNIPLRPLFQYTSLLLIFIAAGLLASAIAVLQAADLLPVLRDTAFNLSHVLSDQGSFGIFLRGLFGYNAEPSVGQFGAWLLYLLAFVTLWTKGYRNA